MTSRQRATGDPGRRDQFAFGENWADFASQLDDKRLGAAVEGITHLLPERAWKGSRVLDIGSGSGIHAAAILRYGASELVAVDVDPESVDTTRSVLSALVPEASWQALRRSVLDGGLSDLGQFDIVYSWGVLHHTGRMWEAIETAASRVAPNGHLVIAIYRRTPTCRFWKIEKRFYSKAPAFVQLLIRSLFKLLFVLGLIARGRNPRQYMASYHHQRGMNWHHDVHDWLGGYPYESATPGEIAGFVTPLGFKLISAHNTGRGLGLFGTGCAEYVFVRDEVMTDP